MSQGSHAANYLRGEPDYGEFRLIFRCRKAVSNGLPFEPCHSSEEQEQDTEEVTGPKHILPKRIECPQQQSCRHHQSADHCEPPALRSATMAARTASSGDRRPPKCSTA